MSKLTRIGAFIVAISTLSIGLLATGQAQAAEPFTLKSLTAEVNGSSVAVAALVSAPADVKVENYGVCVRTKAGLNVDYPKSTNVLVTRSGTSTSGTKSFPIGTYTYFACVQRSGTWYLAGAKAQFTVGASPTPTTTTTTTSSVPSTAVPTTTTSSVPSTPVPTSPTTTSGPATPAAVTLFSDDFNGPAGSLVDPAKWGYEVGGGIRNNELQYYTDADADNASLDGSGSLKITVRKEAVGGRAYTSAMLMTKGKFDFTLGCVEARAKTPTGSGLWPAIWTVGSAAKWPLSGELDVMEQINGGGWQNMNVHGGPQHWSAYGGFAIAPGAWHVYKACITTTDAKFYFDGVLKHTVTKGAGGNRSMPAGQTWPFGTYAQYLRLNVAMGGDWPGTPDGSAALPATMYIDYIKVTQ